MSDWQEVNEHYWQNGNYTITKTKNVPLPYCLFKLKPEVFYGCFPTSREAVKRYKELINEQDK